MLYWIFVQFILLFFMDIELFMSSYCSVLEGVNLFSGVRFSLRTSFVISSKCLCPHILLYLPNLSPACKSVAFDVLLWFVFHDRKKRSQIRLHR